MIQDSVLISNSIEESIKLSKSAITQINGKVINDDSRHIHWFFKYGLQKVECETQFLKYKNKTQITTIANSDDIWQKGAKKAIENFFTTFFKNKEITIPNQIPTRKISKKEIEKKENINNVTYYWKESVIGFIILVLIFSYFNNNTSTSTYITKSGYYATSNESDLNTLLKLTNDNDRNAIDEFYNNARFFKLRPQQEVFLIKSNFGTIKIRPKGKSMEYWTVKEAIELK